MLIESEYLLRMALASLCGLAVGFERQKHHKNAGIATFTIVALASAMMMEISKYGFQDVAKVDASRIASQVVSGISFLVAGIIIKRNQNIEGLTTAAAIWAIAGIGLAFGAGMYFIGLSCTALFLILNASTRKLKEKEKVYNAAYKIKTDSKEWAISLDQKEGKNKILSYALDKQNDVYLVTIVIRFSNNNEKKKWESNILQDSHLISYRYES